MSYFSKLFFYFLLVSNGNLFAQIRVENTCLTDKTRKIIYAGIPNPIEIYFPDSTEFYSVKTSSAKCSINHLKQINRLSYSIYYPAIMIGKTDTIDFYYHDSLIASVPFEIKRIADPVVRLTESMDTILTLEQVIDNDYLMCILPNCYYRSSMQVISARVTLIHNNRKKTITFSGGWFSEFTRFDKLRTGDKLHFDKIRAVSSDSCTRSLGSFTITISSIETTRDLSFEKYKKRIRRKEQCEFYY